jgi:UDP-N-acetylglucosamine diphosphorylase/glucosamine-1-phosphate N-acetyltransferase
MNFGTGTLLTRIEDRTARKASDLFVPEYLRETTKETHPDANVNSDVSSKCLIINSLIADRPEIWHAVEQAVAEKKEVMYSDSTGTPVFGILDGVTPKQVEQAFKKSPKSKLIDSENGESGLIRFPWNLVEQNGLAIASDFSTGYSNKQHAEGDFESRGSRFSISSMTDIERYVTLDSRNGPIIIEDGAHIQSFSHVTGPCFIGKGTVVKSAKIREGTSISEFCRVSGEIEQSIISSYTNKNHDGFVGHSIIGSWVNLGALTTTSDLKNTYGEIKVNVGGKRVNTGNNKVGAFVGDMAKTAIGTMINSGKCLGASAFALGYITDDVPSFAIYSGTPKNRGVEMYIDSAIETQRRMMSRRGIKISDAYATMMKEVFKMTKRDRTARRVSKGKFKN